MSSRQLYKKAIQWKLLFLQILSLEYFDSYQWKQFNAIRQHNYKTIDLTIEDLIHVTQKLSSIKKQNTWKAAFRCLFAPNFNGKLNLFSSSNVKTWPLPRLWLPALVCIIVLQINPQKMTTIDALG